MSKTRKIFLPENEMPTQWYNIQADIPTPLKPPLHPGTKQPIGPEDLAPLFPMELIKQEVSTERWIGYCLFQVIDSIILNTCQFTVFEKK